MKKNINKYFRIFKIFIAIFIFSNISFSQVIDSPEITKEEIFEHIKFLASDELQGRMTGSEHIKMAADYIKNEFEKSGLKPAFNGSFFQEFPFISELKLGKNNFKLSGKLNKEVSLNKDFIPLSFSDNITVQSELVFAGFGISSSELNYDDYKNIDVKNKIIIVFRNNPELNNRESKFNRLSSFRVKTSVARDKGAKGIIFVNTSENKDEDKLVNLRYDGAGKVKGIVAIHVKRDVIEKILQLSGKTLDELEKNLIETKSPSSFVINGIKAEINAEITEIESKCINVGGILEGNDPKLKNEYLVIGAHYDHLGWGGTPNSLHQGPPAIHNGADDNASGTTGLLELSEKFSQFKHKLKRSLIFFAFSGEEIGLLGSSYLVKNFPVPIENAVAMFNMDMIGRLKENNLIVSGTGTSANWKNILNEKNIYNFKLSFNDEGFGPSDHAAFYGAKIPVLFFFTGTHQDYHRPSDDIDKINPEGQKMILEYIYNVAEAVLNFEQRPNYIAVESKDNFRINAPRVWVGTIPDFAGNVSGYKLSGISEGSPAAIAGLKAGDVIIKFGESNISNLYDFTYAISNYKPGDKVKVIVKRDNEEKEFELILKSK